MALFVSAGSAIDEGSRGVSIGSFGTNESTDGLAGSMMGGFALCKEQTAQAKRNAFCKIMVYFLLLLRL